MKQQTALFRDRQHAGKLLAEQLVSDYANREDVIVLALPRGGVPVAYEVAARLSAPLDVLNVRKLGVPGYEEMAMGAIAAGDVRVINQDVVQQLRIPQSAIDRTAEAERRELEQRERLFRDNRPAPDTEGKTVILVDDGLATGATMVAAVTAVRRKNPRRVVVAVPTASPAACQEFEAMVDETVCLNTPANFGAVGMWYEDFPQTSTEEVRALLQQAAAGTSAG